MLEFVEWKQGRRPKTLTINWEKAEVIYQSLREIWRKHKIHSPKAHEMIKSWEILEIRLKEKPLYIIKEEFKKFLD